MVIRFEMDFFQCCQGYNATLLAYGQTGSGKSYSMVGYGANKGLVPKLSERLFQDIKGNLQTKQCQVCVCVCYLVIVWNGSVLTLIFTSTQVFFSMLEIYNEQVRRVAFWFFSPSLIFFLSSLPCASRCLTCWFGGLARRGDSGSERSNRGASTWRDYEPSRVKVQHR